AVVADAGELPLAGRDLDALVRLVLAHRETGGRGVERGRRVAARVVIGAERDAGDARLVGDEFSARQAGDRRAIAGRDGQLHGHAARAGQQVTLPAGPDDAVAAPHQEAVARVLGGGRGV